MSAASVGHETVELAFEPAPEKSADAVSISDTLYEAYSLQSIRIPGAQPHPSKLVQSGRHGIRCAARAHVSAAHPAENVERWPCFPTRNLNP